MSYYLVGYMVYAFLFYGLKINFKGSKGYKLPNFYNKSLLLSHQKQF